MIFYFSHYFVSLRESDQRHATRGGVRSDYGAALRPQESVLPYQMAVDVLVAYCTSRHHLVDYNCPQKISEHMLAGRSIVTPKYPGYVSSVSSIATYNGHAGCVDRT